MSRKNKGNFLKSYEVILSEPHLIKEGMLISTALNLLAKEIRADNETWWRNPATGEKLTRNRPEMMMLMVSEIAEAMEGFRKDLMDDKLPHRKMETVEFADLFIRLMDYVGEFCPDFGEAVAEKWEFNKTRKDHTPEARLAENGKKF
jgi:NTP pyrophosphatase (non-canonical NTP hydrolase)